MKHRPAAKESTKDHSALALVIVLAALLGVSIAVTAWVIVIGIEQRPGSPAVEGDVDKAAAERRLQDASR